MQKGIVIIVNLFLLLLIFIFTYTKLKNNAINAEFSEAILAGEVTVIELDEYNDDNRPHFKDSTEQELNELTEILFKHSKENQRHLPFWSKYLMIMTLITGVNLLGWYIYLKRKKV